MCTERSRTRSRHLRRLDWLYTDLPIYFVTTCSASRRRVLAEPRVASIVRSEFEAAAERYGWRVGRYVIMPDHLHFFCALGGRQSPATLSQFIRGFKQWTAKRIIRDCGLSAPIWQPEFFDRLLRSAESYEQKWRYVMENPVRAGLVEKVEDWPFAGEIAAL